MLRAHLMLVPPQVQGRSQQLLGNSLLGVLLPDPLASHHQGVGSGGTWGAALPIPEMWGAMRGQPPGARGSKGRDGSCNWCCGEQPLPAVGLSPLCAAFLCPPAGTTVSSQPPLLTGACCPRWLPQTWMCSRPWAICSHNRWEGKQEWGQNFECWLKGDDLRITGRLCWPCNAC